jgi:WD40 repeat protein
MSADGLCAVSGSAGDASVSGELLLWYLHLEDPSSLLMTEGRQLPVRGLGISADGEWVIGGGGGWLAAWDRTYAFYPIPLRGHSHWGVRAVAMSADGRRAISGSSSGELLLWDLVDGNPNGLYQLLGHKSDVVAAAISADGERAITGGEAGELFLWNLSGETAIRQSLPGHTLRVGAVAMSADGMWAMSGGGRDLLLWDLTGEQPRSLLLPGHTRAVEAVAIRADNARAISGSAGELLFWDISSPMPLSKSRSSGPTGWVNSVAVSANGRRAVTMGLDVYTDVGEQLVWDMSQEQPTSTPLPMHEASGSVQISANGERALINGRLWDLSGDQPICHPLPSSGNLAAAMSADGSRAISADGDRLLLWDISKEQPSSTTLPGHEASSSAVEMSANGTRAITISRDATVGLSDVLLWDFSGDEPTSQLLLGHVNSVKAVEMSADGTRAIVISGGMREETGLLLLDFHAGEATSQPLLGHVHSVDEVKISADGTRAISRGGDAVEGQHELLLWDLSDDQPILHPLLGHTLRFLSMAISPDGRWAASSSAGELRIWDLESRMSTMAVVDGVINSIGIAQPTSEQLEILTGEWAGALTAWTVWL